jgi:hypothetical protein
LLFWQENRVPQPEKLKTLQLSICSTLARFDIPTTNKLRLLLQIVFLDQGDPARRIIKTAWEPLAASALEMDQHYQTQRDSKDLLGGKMQRHLVMDVGMDNLV